MRQAKNPQKAACSTCKEVKWLNLRSECYDCFAVRLKAYEESRKYRPERV